MQQRPNHQALLLEKGVEEEEVVVQEEVEEGAEEEVDQEAHLPLQHQHLLWLNKMALQSNHRLKMDQLV